MRGTLICVIVEAPILLQDHVDNLQDTQYMIFIFGAKYLNWSIMGASTLIPSVHRMAKVVEHIPDIFMITLNQLFFVKEK